MTAKVTTTIDVRNIIPRERHPLIFSTFDNLAPGDAFLLVNDHDPKPLHYQFEAEYKGHYEWQYEQQGPKDWTVKLKRSAAYDSYYIALAQGPRQGRVLIISALLYGAGFALFGLSPTFLLSLALLAFVGATDTVWSAARGTILQIITPERFRGRVMGVFQLSNRGLHPLGQTETGLVVPLIGAREATFFGGLLVTVVTLVTAWQVPGIAKFRWNETGTPNADGKKSEPQRVAG